MGTAHDALIEGQQAGRLQLPAGLNPYKVGTAEYAEWYRGWLAATARSLLQVADLARRVA